MHVSRQPNSERWVQSNSPFSLVLRDRVDSKLAVAWSKLLAKADWDREWVWLREQWDGEVGEWEREWLGGWFVWGEWGVIFEFTFFEIEYQTLGFTLSKPSLWGLRSMWCVHVELKF